MLNTYIRLQICEKRVKLFYSLLVDIKQEYVPCLPVSSDCSWIESLFMLAFYRKLCRLSRGNRA